MENTIFDSSGGALISYNKDKPSSVVRVHSTSFSITKSHDCVTFCQADIELNNVNFSNNACQGIYITGYGPKKMSSRFISLISNECELCSKLEADFSCINKNSRFQFVRNNCSSLLLKIQRADCHCDWFYFIDNNVTNCLHVDDSQIDFTNSFSTSYLKLLLGTTNGVVNLNIYLTELPFPSVLILRPCSMRSMSFSVILFLITLSVAEVFVS